jgi:tRNA pseudouridine38-40 synthase
MKLLLKISFLGTNYNGYQVQPNKPTVQRELNEAARRIFGFDCDVVGCSRTDSGVHANEFFACVSKKGENELECTIPTDKIPLAFNSVLPDDISVLEGRMVESEFHPRYDVKHKEYIYKIWNNPIKNPFFADRAYHIPTVYSDEAIRQMNEAAKHFCGRHDFASFMAQGSKITDTSREIKYANVYVEGDFIIFKVAADGFLYNMVRIMTGTLLLVAQGKIAPSDIEKITESKNRKNAGPTVPACGLYLNKVEY